MTSPGLRELKKARTRRTIREHALRLFAERGYAATTVDQIAEAAEVSPSTFFRYFPTKDHVVLDEDADPVLVAAARALPEGVPVARGLREAILAVLDGHTPPAGDMLAMTRLAFGEPDLRARTLEHALATEAALAGILAERLGRDPGDMRLHVFAGAVLAAWVTAMRTWSAEDGVRPLAEYLDANLAYLEAGLPL
ncbi:TetR family transcriptional regulator [Actinorhabdospora filicis]|uniref:TetR family transcriptional regulator n=1 Tax=Actinorhabdospora filicis TaxID=1785913 RepID=A0A9W6SMK7_9ACTN|nr:TetR family transcriptional regulator [Actinorhabdospora filicis]GLZ79690.1 TetR family transcriptional regulator [Actinorhabdospora filicis]